MLNPHDHFFISQNNRLSTAGYLNPFVIQLLLQHLLRLQRFQ